MNGIRVYHLGDPHRVSWRGHGQALPAGAVLHEDRKIVETVTQHARQWFAASWNQGHSAALTRALPYGYEAID